MFDWIVSDTYQYLEPFNFVDLFTNHIYLMYVYKLHLS